MPLVYTNGIVFCVNDGAKMALEKQQNQVNRCESDHHTDALIEQLASVQKPCQWISYYHVPQMTSTVEQQWIRSALAAQKSEIQDIQYDLSTRHVVIYHSHNADHLTLCLDRLKLGATLQQTQPYYEPLEPEIPAAVLPHSDWKISPQNVMLWLQTMRELIKKIQQFCTEKFFRNGKIK